MHNRPRIGPFEPVKRLLRQNGCCPSKTDDISRRATVCRRIALSCDFPGDFPCALPLRLAVAASGAPQNAFARGRRIRPNGRPVGPEEGRIHLSTVPVISPGDPGGAEILANSRLSFGVVITLVNLMTLGVIGAGNAGSPSAFSFDRASFVIIISFDDLEPAPVIRSRIEFGALKRRLFRGSARVWAFVFH